MKKIFNITMLVLHIIGLAIASEAAITRFIFFYDWPIKDDLMVWAIIAAVFLIHYGILFVGYRANILSTNFLYILRRVEFFQTCFHLGVILLFIILFKVTFNSIYPILAISVIAHTIRLFSNWHLLKKTRKTGDGLREP